MDKLIQTQQCSIIYGDFRGEPNQELFRCPRSCDDTDLKNYVERERCLLGFENDKATEDLQKVEGMELLDHWRMYFRDGWQGRWMGTAYGGWDENKVSKIDCIGVNHIIDWLVDNFPHGCNWEMQEHLLVNYEPWSDDGKRYLLKPLYSDLYKVMIDTTYGNGDYPVRIYVYKRKENGAWAI
jgi:hypothetical protein